VPQPGKPQALNRYSYVYNNPMRYVDPTGYFTEEELLAWGISQEQIDAWKKGDAAWWSLMRAAELGDRFLAWSRWANNSVVFYFHLYKDSHNSTRLGLQQPDDIFLGPGTSTLELTRRSTIRETCTLERQSTPEQWEEVWSYYNTAWIGKPGQGLYFRPDRLDAGAILGDLASLGIAVIAAGYDPKIVGKGLSSTARAVSNLLSGKQTLDALRQEDYWYAGAGAVGLLPGGAVASALLSLATDVSRAFYYEPGY